MNSVLEMDTQFLRKPKKAVHPKVKSQMEKLASPSESVEFMEHMLEQTKTVENLRKALRKSGKFTSIVGSILLIYSFATMYFGLSKD